MSIAVDFYTGTYQDYIDLVQYNKEPYINYADNALYFCTDQQIMFKGKTLIGKPYQSLTKLTNGLPAIEQPIEDILYLYDEGNLIFVYKNKQWIKIFGNHICSIEHFNNTLNIVKWDRAERKLTLPQITDISTGEVSSLIINLGKDIILEEGSYYDENNKVIRLKLAIPDTEDAGEDDQYIDIPVGDLVDIYDVEDSSSIALTLTSNTTEEESEKSINKYLIKAEIIVASDQIKPNALENLDDGLYVDVQTYADAKYKDAEAYIEKRLNIGDNLSITVQSLLDQKANVNTATLNNPILNAPVLNEAIVNSTGIDTNIDLWSNSDYDSHVATVKIIKDLITTDNTWGAISYINTWGNLNGGEET